MQPLNEKKVLHRKWLNILFVKNHPKTEINFHNFFKSTFVLHMSIFEKAGESLWPFCTCNSWLYFTYQVTLFIPFSCHSSKSQLLMVQSIEIWMAIETFSSWNHCSLISKSRYISSYKKIIVCLLFRYLFTVTVVIHHLSVQCWIIYSSKHHLRLLQISILSPFLFLFLFASISLSVSSTERLQALMAWDDSSPP